MADTLNFGPEWLRALSDGNNPGTPPPSPGIIGKYKLADYRYGKEEMLALNNPNHTEPLEEIKKFTYIYVEKPQEPITMQSLSEEEQRLMSQSVNSTAVLRMFGRGGPPGVRGGRGGIERGRGRGRGRGDSGFLQRGMSAEEGGGFGRPPTHSRSDGWEEVGAKRNYNPRFDEEGGPQRQFHRSLNNENWRDREGSMRRMMVTGEKQGLNGTQEVTENQLTEEIEEALMKDHSLMDYQGQALTKGDNTKEIVSVNHGMKMVNYYNMPEWSMPDTTGDDVGTFDSSGAFVSTKKKPGEKGSENHERREPHTETSEKKDNVKHKSPDKPKVETKVETDKVKRPPPNLENRQNKSENANKRTLEPRENKTVTSESPGQSSKPVNSRQKENNNEVKVSKENNSAQNDFSKSEATMKNEETNVSLKKEKVEAETLARLQAAAENVVLSAMTAEDDEKEKMVPRPAKDSTALPSDHEDALKWFYKDPQGDMQGPFTPNEMAEWFSAGYFTMNLQVKRGIDEKISPLGELIKSWGRVPFLPGPSPPPALNTPTSQATADQQEQMKALQQMLVQQQMMQQQFLMRQLQMQQIQQVMQQLQENDQFKNLPPLQQQQLAMQLMLKQSPVPIIPPQTQMQNLSPRSPPTESVSPSNPSHPAFHRSASQPNTASEESIWDTTTKQNMGQWSQPTSVWDLDSKAAMTNTDLEMQIEKARKVRKEELDRIRQEKDEEERRIQEELKRHQEEIIKQQEELRRQKEDVERQKIEIEKQRQLELQRFEEVRRQNQEEEERKRREVEEEERRRKEDQMRKEEQMRQKQEEAVRRKREEDMRREEEMRQQQRQMMEQQHKQREMEEQQNNNRRCRDDRLVVVSKMKKIEEARQQQELHRQKQQQEALKRLQQEQMANIQLPQHAQWASQQQQQSLEQQRAKSLLEIQEQEEIERQRQEEIQRQVEAQRQQTTGHTPTAATTEVMVRTNISNTTKFQIINRNTREQAAAR
ncbi:GIGYF [Mytilus edulis]|uniref:GIGYF n=1 Tax=Mytilus edulis TaxID=6550 RepID=A0A8S3Q3V1_MYTED|nr:GIGYF [Mytilus edulis]